MKRNRIFSDPSDPNKRYLYQEEETNIPSNDDITNQVRNMVEDAVNKIPKQVLGTKKIGWMVVVGYHLMRAKTFDYSSATLSSFGNDATFESAIKMVEDLRKKVYMSFGRELPAIRQDLKGQNQ